MLATDKFVLAEFRGALNDDRDVLSVVPGVVQLPSTRGADVIVECPLDLGLGLGGVPALYDAGLLGLAVAMLRFPLSDLRAGKAEDGLGRSADNGNATTDTGLHLGSAAWESADDGFCGLRTWLGNRKYSPP